MFAAHPHYAPRVDNLAREGITRRVQLVGDVMYELLREHAATAPTPRSIFSSQKLWTFWNVWEKRS